MIVTVVITPSAPVQLQQRRVGAAPHTRPCGENSRYSPPVVMFGRPGAAGPLVTGIMLQARWLPRYSITRATNPVLGAEMAEARLQQCPGGQTPCSVTQNFLNLKNWVINTSNFRIVFLHSHKITNEIWSLQTLNVKKCTDIFNLRLLWLWMMVCAVPASSNG